MTAGVDGRKKQKETETGPSRGGAVFHSRFRARL